MNFNTASWTDIAASWSDIACSPTEQSEVLATAAAHHIVGTLFKHHRGHPAPELRTDAPDVPHVILGLFEEESEEPDMPAPEARDRRRTRKEEDAILVLKRFLAICIVHRDGLRRMPSAG